MSAIDDAAVIALPTDSIETATAADDGLHLTEQSYIRCNYS